MSNTNSGNEKPVQEEKNESEQSKIKDSPQSKQDNQTAVCTHDETNMKNEQSSTGTKPNTKTGPELKTSDNHSPQKRTTHRSVTIDDPTDKRTFKYYNKLEQATFEKFNSDYQESLSTFKSDYQATLTNLRSGYEKAFTIYNKHFWIRLLGFLVLVETFTIISLILNRCNCSTGLENSTFFSSNRRNPSEYKDFNSYYGISSSKNHFTIPTDNTCKSDIIFKSILPSTLANLGNSPTSFMILSNHGTGKTSLRCLYFNNLQSSDYLKVLVSNEQIDEYFQRFISESKGTSHSIWSENEFNQIILSASVTQFVNIFNEEQFELPQISLNQKIELSTIICYYYNDLNADRLETFVNAFLRKSHDKRYTADTMKAQFFERNSYRDKPLLQHFKRDLKKLNVISQDQKKLELLLDVIEGENYQNSAIDRDIGEAVFESLTKFTQFMKHDVKRPVVFIIDSIDENRYFSNDNTVDQLSLELFYSSSLSSEIVSSTLSKKFYLALFYWDINGTYTVPESKRRDKFPVYTIEWNKKLLIDYADYVLEEMNLASSNDRYKQLPDFKQLVHYTDQATNDILQQIQTPKHLHSFMAELIREMNKCSKDVEEPFIATYDNVEKAFRATKN